VPRRIRIFPGLMRGFETGLSLSISGLKVWVSISLINSITQKKYWYPYFALALTQLYPFGTPYRCPKKTQNRKTNGFIPLSVAISLFSI
jgi:hypothetical protein